MGELRTIVLLSGICLAVGVFLVLIGARRGTPRLSDVLGAFEPGSSAADPVAASTEGHVGWDVRLGSWAFTHGVPVPVATRRTLDLQGRTVAEFVAQRILLALGGLLAPLLYSAVGLAFGTPISATPMIWSLALAALGFCWPDISLRQQADLARADARAALMSLFDLAILERMANQSAVSSLQSAANMSDVRVFTRIRGALDRARLEQRQPWDDLGRVARDLDLPEVSDLVDIMRLDDQGAALADALRARVTELRDANLTRDKAQAQRVSESMTLWMVVPTLIFGLILLTPPILRIAGLA